MFYAVTDRENKDRENPVLDVFRSHTAAVDYLAEYPGDPAALDIERWTNLSDLLGGPGYEWDWTSPNYACHTAP